MPIEMFYKTFYVNSKTKFGKEYWMDISNSAIRTTNDKLLGYMVESEDGVKGIGIFNGKGEYLGGVSLDFITRQSEVIPSIIIEKQFFI